MKWPNDVWIDERKLAGVLIEAQPPAWAVIGIGLNVAIEPDEFPADLRQPATSMGHGVGVEDALAAVCERLEHWVDAAADRVVAEFTERDALAGRPVSWMGAGGRTAEGERRRPRESTSAATSWSSPTTVSGSVSAPGRFSCPGLDE